MAWPSLFDLNIFIQSVQVIVLESLGSHDHNLTACKQWAVDLISLALCRCNPGDSAQAPQHINPGEAMASFESPGDDPLVFFWSYDRTYVVVDALRACKRWNEHNLESRQ